MASSWQRHVLRHDVLLQEIIERRTKGRVFNGRKRIDMLSDLASGKISISN